MTVDAIRETRARDLFEDRQLFSEEERVSKAVGHLLQTGEYEVFVTKEKRLAMATVRDLLGVKNHQTTRLGNIAYFSPELRADDDLGKAARLMFEYRLRAVPSISAKGSVKVITASGILDRMAETGQIKAKASEIMTPGPVTIRTDDTVEKARQLMMRRSFDHLPVMKGEKLAGMLKSSHILSHMLPEEGIRVQFRGMEQVRFDYPASRIADENVIQVEPSASLIETIKTITGSKSSYALVTLWGEIQGIITLRDIVKLLVKRERASLPFYIVGLPDEPFEAEAAKLKVERLGASLTKIFPYIEEIRAIVKKKETGGPRRRYEVTVNIYTPKQLHAYTSEGYDLSEIFDELIPKLKKLLSSRQSRVTKSHGESLRKGRYPA